MVELEVLRESLEPAGRKLGGRQAVVLLQAQQAEQAAARA